MNGLFQTLAAGADGRRLLNQRTGAVLAADVVTAFDSTARRKGLLGDGGMPDDRALVIAPCEAVHTWFMHFPIDIMFVARDGRVVKVRRRVRPWRIAGAWRAFGVIEMAAGAIDRSGIAVGDYVTAC